MEQEDSAVAVSTGSTASMEERSRRADADLRGRPLPLWHTWLVIGLVIAATAYGLLDPDAYRVTEYLTTIWRAQDAVTLAAMAGVVWAAHRALGMNARWL